METAQTFHLSNTLKRKGFDEAEAIELIEFIEKSKGETITRSELKAELKSLATKDDIISLHKEISNIHKEMRGQNRWMIALFITLILAFAGLYFKK